jgi:uncharacterized integral membrane protein
MKAARVMDLKPPPGVRAAPYPIWRDVAYRMALALGALAMAVILVGGATGRPDGVLWVLAVATAGAAWMFFVWMPMWRYLVLGLTAIGVVLMVWAAWPWAVGFYLAALSVMAAKEDHCFHFIGGKYFPWAALVAVGFAVFDFPPAARIAAWAVATALFWLFALERWRLPWLRLSSEASQGAAPTPPTP